MYTASAILVIFSPIVCVYFSLLSPRLSVFVKQLMTDRVCRNHGQCNRTPVWFVPKTVDMLPLNGTSADTDKVVCGNSKTCTTFFTDPLHLLSLTL